MTGEIPIENKDIGKRCRTLTRRWWRNCLALLVRQLNVTPNIMHASTGAPCVRSASKVVQNHCDFGPNDHGPKSRGY
jgi:hypothetical protein